MQMASPGWNGMLMGSPCALACSPQLHEHWLSPGSTQGMSQVRQGCKTGYKAAEPVTLAQELDYELGKTKFGSKFLPEMHSRRECSPHS